MKLLNLPILPLRDIVVFPHMVAPLFVGRKMSINALNKVMLSDKKILLITQKSSDIDNPSPKNLYNFGTVAKILQLLKLPDGTVKVLVEGLERAKVYEIKDNNDFLLGNYKNVQLENKNKSKVKALTKIVIEQFDSYQKINKKVPVEVINNIKSYTDSNKISDVIIANLNISLDQKQKLLEINSTEDILEKIYNFLLSEIDTIQVEKKIKGRVKRQMEKTQKEYYLNEQMKAIQKELGDGDDYDDLTDLENKINKLKNQENVRMRFGL